MGYNYTLGQMLSEKKQRYDEVLRLECINYDNEQLKIFADAIDSIDYICSVFNGKIVLPCLSEDINSDCGKVFMWLAGSFKNIDLADQILSGEYNQNAEYIKREQNEILLAWHETEEKLKEAEGQLHDTKCELNAVKASMECAARATEMLNDYMKKRLRK